MQCPAARSFRISARRPRVAITSRPLVGSSSSRFRGACTSARASATLMRSPCEKPFARRSAIAAEVELGDELLDARRRARRRSSPCSSPEVGDVLARGELRVDAGAVRQHADPARAPRAGRTATSTPSTAARAGVGREHGVEDAQRRGLAGAVRAEQAGDAPVPRLEADAVAPPARRRSAARARRRGSRRAPAEGAGRKARAGSRAMQASSSARRGAVRRRTGASAAARSGRRATPWPWPGTTRCRPFRKPLAATSP